MKMVSIRVSKVFINQLKILRKMISSKKVRKKLDYI